MNKISKPTYASCSILKDENIAEYIRTNFEGTEEIEIRCCVNTAVEIPEFFNEYSISVSWADATFQTKNVPAINKKCIWLEKLNKRIVKIPTESDKLPYAFVYLKNTTGKIICFARLDPSEFKDVCKGSIWAELVENQAGKISRSCAGFVNIRLYFGKYTENENERKGRWNLPSQDLSTKRYKLLFNLYQCKELPEFYSSSQLRLFVEIYCDGQTTASDIINSSPNPMWFCVLPLEIQASVNSSLPVIIKIIGINQSDDLFDIGYCVLNTSQCTIDSLTPAFPTWTSLSLNGISSGLILCSMNLYIKASPPKSVECKMNIPEQMPYSITPELSEFTIEINCLGLRDLVSSIRWLPVNKAHIKFDLQSLMIPGSKFALNSILTQPGCSGSNPTINSVIKFTLIMPVNQIFAPTLTCIVYDYLFKGISQPEIGRFSIELGKFMNKLPKKLKIGQKSRGAKSEDVLIGLDETNCQTEENNIRVMQAPSLEEARKGAFVIFPTYLEGNGRMKESFKPDRSYMKLGYDRNISEKCMHYRYLLDGCFEDSEYIERSPFESFSIRRVEDYSHYQWLFPKFYTGSDEADHEKNVGSFKGLIRVVSTKKLQVREAEVLRIKNTGKNEEIDHEDEDFIDIRKKLLKARQLIARVYVVACEDLVQKDCRSQSDPYVRIKLAGHVINDIDNTQSNQPAPRFLKHFDIPVTLPGPSSLKIQIWDKNDLNFDTKIGETIIDLEDRYFSNKWARIPEKPIESRKLLHKSTTLPQGTVLLWLELHQPNALPPALNISDKPPELFELRLIIWQTKGIAAADLSDASDIYIRASVDSLPGKETDTHCHCSTGCGQFNWRMKFFITLPSSPCILNLQIWDRDIFNANDFIGSTFFSFKDFANECFLSNKRATYFDSTSASNFMKRPNERFWLRVYKDSKETLESGLVEISLEVLPKSAALACAVGEGRSSPNVDPFLPEPRRSEISINPCNFIRKTLSPSIRRKLCCVLVFTFICYLLVMAAPALFAATLTTNY